MIKGKILIFMMTLVFGAITSLSYGFEVNVHRAITKNAGENTSLLLDGKIKDAGLLNGIKEKFNGKEPIELLQDGSQKEDEPLLALRYLKHFYNPIDDSGLLFYNSSYVWANDYYANAWSWRAARSKFYEGLTATTGNARGYALANSFRALGQVMHLVQDLASVAHTRDDAHPLYDGFEAYTKKKIGSLPYSAAAISIPATAVSPYAPRQFWDSDTYDGTNPSSSSSLGLSEYTNANFFSGDTILRYFPYPAWSNLEEYEVENERTGEVTTYLRKLGDGVTNGGKVGYGEPIEHLATAKWFYKYLPEESKYLGLKLDDTCYKDYASLLIPRAVGYSAGLLNYFFRGKMDMYEDPQGPGTFIIENKSDEPMSGTFSLFYDYEEGTEVKRKSVESWILSEENGEAIGAKGKSGPLTFITPSYPAPKEKGKYILVFHGKLGNEEGAVAGKVVNLSSIWEPFTVGEYMVDLEFDGGKNFTIETGKHTWLGGFYTGDSPEPDIRVGNGTLNINAHSGTEHESSGWLDAGGSPMSPLPVAKCQLKMNIPSAEFAKTDYYSMTCSGTGCGGNTSYLWLMFLLYNGEKEMWLFYGIAEGSRFWDWPYQPYSNLGRTWIGTGEISRNIAEDFSSTVSARANDPGYSFLYSEGYIGDINKWYITGLQILYRFDKYIYSYPTDNSLSASIDYIDFQCE